MSDTVIKVENLGKMYQIGETIRHDTFRDLATESFLRHIMRRNVRHKKDMQAIWALKDVSFEVKRGEVIGIIGRNGAGKSTLLKILSRITEPTSGRAEIYGRVGSLLEVGTGFHPELTGRENIYLNGAILGMARNEIHKRFDEIVAFAEIEKFLDTPVKRYSSGMYVRLAFAVAAHLEPEILLVDEVLAVGDAGFQKKCLGKMKDVTAGGRTVLLVSHNMGVVKEIAERSIWINEGRIMYVGKAPEAVSMYLSSGQAYEDGEVDLSQHQNRLKGMKRILRRIVCRKEKGGAVKDFFQSEEIILEVDYDATGIAELAGIGFIVYTTEGIRVGGFNSYMAFSPPHSILAKGKALFVMPAKQFTPGDYLVTVSLGSHQGVLEDKVEHALCFTVHQSDIYGTGYLLTKEDGVAALSVKTFIQ